MAYYPVNAYSQGHQQTILLLSTPLQYQRKLGFKRVPDLFSHWAVCIDGRCYELTRNRNPDKKSKKEARYHMNSEHNKEEWSSVRNLPAGGYNEYYVGQTSRRFSHHELDRVAVLVWAKSLQSKYVVDEANCQVFCRLLIDLIGDPTTKLELPSRFDAWSKRAGLTRDASSMLFIAGANTVAATAALAAAPVDMGATAGGFAVASLTALTATTNLWASRIMREKFIKKSQEELAEQLRKDRILA